MTHDEIIEELMILNERKWTENSTEALMEAIEIIEDYKYVPYLKV